MPTRKRLGDTPARAMRREALAARQAACRTADVDGLGALAELPQAVEPGALLTPTDLDVVNRHLGGVARPRAYAEAHGLPPTSPHTRSRSAAFFGRPEVQAALAAAVAHGLRDGIDSRESFVADQHKLIEEARLAGQYGPAMSGRATLARVLGIDQAAPLSVHRGTSDQELLLQLRVALGPAVADAAARELLGDEGTGEGDAGG